MRKSFVVGSSQCPQWLEEQAAKGRIRVNYDEDGDLLNIILYGATKQYIAKPGDTILLNKNGLAVVKKLSKGGEEE